MLIYTVALNGYAAAYRRCLRSQRAYCRRQGFHHVAVTRPVVVEDRAVAAWLKVTLLREALDSGYDWVACIDSDAAVAPSAPDFTVDLSREHDVHLARGRSGRLNSGVILVRNTAPARAFVRRVVASMTEPVDEADRAGLKFENGNIIACARESDAVGVMDARWNNTTDPSLDDHVRHYTGDLRSHYRRSALDEAVLRARRALTERPAAQPERRGEQFVTALESLTAQTTRRYPQLVSAVPVRGNGHAEVPAFMHGVRRTHLR